MNCRISKHLYPWASLCKQVRSPPLNHGLKSMILLTWPGWWPWWPWWRMRTRRIFKDIVMMLFSRNQDHPRGWSSSLVEETETYLQCCLHLLGSLHLGVGDQRNYTEFSVQQLDYILGYLEDGGHSFVAGFGQDPPQRSHHAASSCPPRPQVCDWLAFSRPGPNPNILPTPILVRYLTPFTCCPWSIYIGCFGGIPPYIF